MGAKFSKITYNHYFLIFYLLIDSFIIFVDKIDKTFGFRFFVQSDDVSNWVVFLRNLGRDYWRSGTRDSRKRTSNT